MRCHDCSHRLTAGGIQLGLCWGSTLAPQCDDADHGPDSPGWHIRCRDARWCAATIDTTRAA